MTLPAFATNYTWTHGSSDPQNENWSDQNNWSPSDHPPGPGDTATIGTAQNGFTVNVDGVTSVDTVTNVSSALEGAGPLKLLKDMECQNAQLGVTEGISVDGNLTVDPVPGIPPFNTTTLIGPMALYGETSISAHANLAIGAEGFLANGGVFIMRDESSMTLQQTAGAIFENDGFFEVRANTSAMVNGGVSVFSNGVAGYVIIGAGGLLQMDTTLADNGTFTVSSNGLAVLLHTAMLHDGAVFEGDGVTALEAAADTLDGAVTVRGNLNMGSNSLPSLTLNGALEVEEGGNFTWFGGALSGSGTDVTGTVVVDSGGLMTINNIGGCTLRNTIITNNGTIRWLDSGTLVIGYNAAIQNAGTFTAYGDGGLFPITSGASGAGVATFDNSSGTLLKLAGGQHATTIGIPFLNGLVSAHIGNINFMGGGSVGTLRAGPHGAIQLSSGVFTLQNEEGLGGGGTIEGEAGAGAGAVTLGANLVFPTLGTLQVQGGLFVQSSGNIDGQSGALQIESGGRYVWNSGGISNLVVQIQGGGEMDLAGGNGIKSIVGSYIDNQGFLSWTNANDIGVINAGDSVTIDNTGVFSINCDSLFNDEATNRHPIIKNEVPGLITKKGTSGTSKLGALVINLGSIVAEQGDLEIGEIEDATSELAGLEMGGGEITFDEPAILHENVSGSGSIDAKQGLTLADDEVDAFEITFFGDITNEGTILLFFDGPGSVTFQNSFTQTANGRLVIPIRGTNASDFGRVVVAGYNQATLNGTLEARIMDGFAAPIGLSFAFLTAIERSGAFTNLELPQGFGIAFTSGGAALTVTNVVPAQIVVSQVMVGGQLQLSFGAVSNRSYTLQTNSDLRTANWGFFTNFIGDGTTKTISLPGNFPKIFIRVRNP